MQKVKWGATIIITLWLTIWAGIAWGANQDDAFIHLRYAKLLHQTGFITFDGVHATYGTSSLLYVGLLSILTTLTSSPLLPHAVSLGFHFLLFALVSFWFLRPAIAIRQGGLAIAVMLLLLVTPSAVRWLEDGMETSLVMVFAFLTASHLFRQSTQTKQQWGDSLLAVLLGFLLVLLRTELLLLSVLSSAVLMITDAGAFDKAWVSRLLKALPQRSTYVVGSLLAAIFIRFRMGSFLPDTALAKAHGIHSFSSTMSNGFHVIGGALLFGVGFLLLWIVTAFLAIRVQSVRRPATLIVNLLFPTVLLLAALRGQEIQGVRYVIWTFFFSVCWNLLEMLYANRNAPVASSAPEWHNRYATVLGLLCLLALIPDARLSYRLLRTRVKTFQMFNGQNLDLVLPRELGVAGDIGYIAYFSKDQICDISGLVNGRAFAALSPKERVEKCVAMHPTFLLARADQAQNLARFPMFATWKVCGAYDFGNSESPDRHYLIVQADHAQAVCAATSYPQGVPFTAAFVTTHY